MATPGETLAMVAGRTVGKGASSGIDGSVLTQSLLAHSFDLDAASRADGMGTDDENSMCSCSTAMEALNTPDRVQIGNDTQKITSSPRRQLTLAELAVYFEKVFMSITFRLEAMEVRCANCPSESHINQLVADRCQASTKELSQELEAKLMRMTVCSTEQFIKRLDQSAAKLAHALEENEKDWTEETKRIWEAVHSHTHEVNLGKAHAQDATMTGSFNTTDLHSLGDGSEILPNCTLDLSRLTGASPVTASFAKGWDDSVRLVDDFELPARGQEESPSVSVILPPGPPLPQEDYEQEGRRQSEKCHEPTCVAGRQSATQADYRHIFEKSMSLPQLERLSLQRETENVMSQPVNDSPALTSARKERLSLQRETENVMSQPVNDSPALASARRRVAAASAVEPDVTVTAPAQAQFRKSMPARAPAVVAPLSKLLNPRNSAPSARALVSPRMVAPTSSHWSPPRENRSHWSPPVETRQVKEPAAGSPVIAPRNSVTVLPKKTWSPLVENRQITDDKSLVLQKSTGPPVQRAPASVAHPQNGPNVGQWKNGSRRSLHRVKKPEV